MSLEEYILNFNAKYDYLGYVLTYRIIEAVGTERMGYNYHIKSKQLKYRLMLKPSHNKLDMNRFDHDEFVATVFDGIIEECREIDPQAIHDVQIKGVRWSHHIGHYIDFELRYNPRDESR